jgi:hypothetical protein
MTLIVWDIDDVLNELTSNWLKWVDDPFISEKSQLTNSRFEEILGWSRKDYLKSLDRFRREQFINLEPNQLIQNFMARHSRISNLLLSATPLTCAPISARWAFVHFGEWIDGVLMAPSPRASRSSTRMSKRDHIFRLVKTGEQVICIDDQPANILEARDAGAAAFLWPQPWNESSSSQDAVLDSISVTL